MDAELRPAFEGDGDFLFELHRAALGKVIEATWGPWDDAVQRRFHDAWFAQRARLSVVLVDGERVGVLDVRQRPDRVRYLARMELVPAVQGQGLGSDLLRDLIASAAASGARAVELHVLLGNEPARRLYERFGFRAVSLEPPKCRMRLSLGAL
jgi:ribosomal protein S18 acetylase RimI-like enzyme